MAGRIPTGLYNVHVLETNNKPSKNNNPMTALRLEILSPEANKIGDREFRTAGAQFSLYVVFTDKTIGDVVDFATKLGVDLPANGSFEDIVNAVQTWFAEKGPGLTFDMLVSSVEQIRYQDQSPEERAAGAARVPILDGTGQPLKLGWQVNMPRLTDVVGNPGRHNGDSQPY